MSTATISPMAAGVAIYRPETGWPPLRACLMTAIILAVAAVTGLVSFFIAAAVADPSLRTLEGAEAMPQWLVLFAQLVMQVVSVVFVWWAAEMYGSGRQAALALQPVPGGVWTYAKSFLLLSLISGAFSIIAWQFARDDVLTDLSELWPLMTGEFWWLMLLVAVIGAPFSEELLFRGFLQSALAKSRMGFWGAALVTNTAWTALHAGYTLTGLLDVFIAGAVFTWLLWRTGSLWVPIVCHALYNGVIFAVLSVIELPQGGAV